LAGERPGVAHGSRAVNALAGERRADNYRLSMTESAFERVAPTGTAALLFLCDHASNALPAEFGTLGLDPALFGTHIASDIGAAAVTRALAAHFGTGAVLGRWSRLLIDLNRGEDDPTLVMKLSDGSLIPGNARIGEDEVVRRIAAYHAPYHAALISMHSFTPVWKGFARPWEIGILWDRDGRLAKPLIAEFAAAGFTVGDNEPYSGELENDCLWRHGTMRGLPHVLIEMRQDLIADDASATAFAARIAPILERALAAMGPPAIEFSRPRKEC